MVLIGVFLIMSEIQHIFIYLLVFFWEISLGLPGPVVHNYIYNPSTLKAEAGKFKASLGHICQPGLQSGMLSQNKKKKGGREDL